MWRQGRWDVDGKLKVACAPPYGGEDVGDGVAAVGAGAVDKEVGRWCCEGQWAVVIEEVGIVKQELVEPVKGRTVGAACGRRETGEKEVGRRSCGGLGGKDGQCVGNGVGGESEGHVGAKLWYPWARSGYCHGWRDRGCLWERRRRGKRGASVTKKKKERGRHREIEAQREREIETKKNR